MLENIIPLHIWNFCIRCSLEYLPEKHALSCSKNEFQYLSRKFVRRFHRAPSIILWRISQFSGIVDKSILTYRWLGLISRRLITWDLLLESLCICLVLLLILNTENIISILIVYWIVWLSGKPDCSQTMHSLEMTITKEES